MTKVLSRRAFLGTFSAAAAVTFLAACHPRMVEVTTIVEKVIQETVEVEKEKVVEKEVTRVVERVVKETVIVHKEVTRPADGAKSSVIFWGHEDHPLDLAATGFVEAYPGIEYESPHPADRGNKLRTAMAAGGGCPDLYWADPEEAQGFACAGLLTDLSEELAELQRQYHSLKWNETVLARDGRNYGWPGDLGVSGWYYRADLLENLGYGEMDYDAWTWDDFILMSAELAEQGKHTFVMPSSGWYMSVLFEYLMHQFGSPLMSRDGQEIAINNDRGIEALTIIKRAYDTGAALDALWQQPSYYASMKEDELIGQFSAAWETRSWELNLTAGEGGMGKWRVAKFPGGENVTYRSGVYGGAMLISPQCAENQDSAVLFMKYALGSIPGAALCGIWGIIPAYRPYLESPFFLRYWKPLLHGDWLSNEFWAAQEKELYPNYVRLAGWSAITNAIAKEMELILAGSISIEDGFAAAEELARPDFERTKCQTLPPPGS